MATRNCPHCGEIIQFDLPLLEALVCPFCTEQVTPEKSSWSWKRFFLLEWGKHPWSWKRFLLRWAILLVFFVGFPGYLIGPAIIKARKQAKVTQCANNLHQLGKIQNHYRILYGGTNKFFPEETGERFWLRLSDPEIRLIGGSSPEIYECPTEGSSNEGNTDYRGPSSNVNKYKDGDPVGADKVNNHIEDNWGGGGNVLRKSGDVQTVGNDDWLWSKARKHTTP